MKKALKQQVMAGIMAAALTLSGSITAFAGSWQQDGSGWWYQNDDGSWPANTWQWINGKCYYFDESGYMLSGTTAPDGSTVDESGAWTVDGVVQTQGTDAGAGAQTASPANPYDNDVNRAALAAYLYDLKNSPDYKWYYDSQHGGRSLTMDPHFAVLDANGDGVYEVFVYCGGPSMAPHWLLYYDNGVKKKEFGTMPTIGTLENGQFYITGGNHGWFWGELYTLNGGALTVVERLEYDMMRTANYEAVQAAIDQYANRMVTYNMVYFSDENLELYLGGNGQDTGVK